MTLYERARPVVFKLPPETAHDLGKLSLRVAQSFSPVRRLLRRRYAYRHPALEVDLFGRTFPAPVGIAAGFDKDGEVVPALADLGFGYVEIGTVTPRPQRGNPKPRIFRLPADDALKNNMAFPSDGAERVARRLASNAPVAIPLGVSIGKMNASDAARSIDDYARVLEALLPHADYFTINLSCANTPHTFDENSPEHLRRVLSRLAEANATSAPLLVKISPDSSDEELADLIEISHEFDVDGFVATNTTTDDQRLTSPDADAEGAVSGPPLEAKANRTLRAVYALTDRPIIGVGGVRDAESAYRKIRLGADLVQLYTGFVYTGPSTAHRINRGLVERLEADGFETVAEAVGVDAEA